MRVRRGITKRAKMIWYRDINGIIYFYDGHLRYKYCQVEPYKIVKMYNSDYPASTEAHKDILDTLEKLKQRRK